MSIIGFLTGGEPTMKPRLVLAAIALAAVAVVLGSSANGKDPATEHSAASRLTVAPLDAGAAAMGEETTPGSRTGVGTMTGEVGAGRTLRHERVARAPEGYPGRRGQARPVKPSERDEPPFAPTVPPTAEASPPASLTIRAGAAPGAAGDFTIFHNTVAGTSNASAVEPTAANDRNGVLVTGNFYANTSRDNGLTFDSEPLNPAADEVYGGFCCDQVAYAVDRGAYSLVFWLIQYRYDPSAKRNALKLRLFQGRTALLSKSDTCNWNFEPQRNFKLDGHLWFDFNQVSHTSKYLYITTNVRDADKADLPDDPSNDPRVGALIFRIALDDLDDGDCHIDYKYWYEEGNPYISPVQNAGSTMYLATHVPGFIEGDNLRIYSIADASDKLEKKDKDIANYKDIDGDCPLPDGQDPCEDQHDGRMSGFRSGSTIGWLWMADQDKDFPFPHVRVAVFETGTLDKIVEHQIWNRDFAWQLPTVGVNQKGELGVILYAMGGGRFPKAQGFILTNPRVWSGIQMTVIAESTSGTDGWGHYASVRPYGNCPDTFLGSAYTSEGGTQKGRLVWFGREDDGCADLVVTGLIAAPGRVARGERLSMTQLTRNIGSASAAASTTRFYLSRDPVKSADDILLAADTAVPMLGANGSFTGPAAVAIIPSSASGDYHLLACANDGSAVSEITNTNNCLSGQTITVEVP
jgi:CARDB